MRGKIECEEADVSGAFEGMELIAHHRLTLSSTARVGGRVRGVSQANGMMVVCVLCCVADCATVTTRARCKWWQET